MPVHHYDHGVVFNYPESPEDFETYADVHGSGAAIGELLSFNRTHINTIIRNALPKGRDAIRFNLFTPIDLDEVSLKNKT